MTRQHLEQWEAENGRIEEGTFVALRTDWSKRWPDIEQFENRDADGNQHLPGWGLDALKFLIEERGVKSIGHETFDTDASVDTAKNGDIVGERYILGQDTFQLELLTNLDQLLRVAQSFMQLVPNRKMRQVSLSVHLLSNHLKYK